MVEERTFEGRTREPLTLTEAVALALETHPAVGQARAAEDAAAAGLRQAGAARFPLLSAQGSLTRHQEPMIVAPLHGFDPAAPPSFDRNLVQGGLALGYTLFDGGARGARIGQAEAGLGAVQAGAQEARQGVVARVSAAYLGVLTGQEVLAAVRSQTEALGAELARVRLLLDEGKAAQVDLLRVEAALSRVEAQEISIRSGLDVTWGRLSRLTGLDPATLQQRTLVPAGIPSGPAESRDQALARSEGANAGMLRAREDLAGASAGVRIASAALLPKLEATGRYLNFGTLDGDHVQEWQGALQVSYPIFTGGARDSGRERAMAEERRAAEALRMAGLEVEEQVESALAAVAEARALREALQLAVSQSEEVARIETLALEAGAGVQTDFLKAQADLFQARASLAQARQGELLARVELARVTGDLSLDWIRDNTEMVR
jgi:outer membrane protein